MASSLLPGQEGIFVQGLPASVGAELEGLPATMEQRSSTFLASLRLWGMARLTATRAQPQSEALKYISTARALRVLAVGTERALIREGIIQPRRLLPRDDRRGVECALGQAASLDNP